MARKAFPVGGPFVSVVLNKDWTHASTIAFLGKKMNQICFSKPNSCFLMKVVGMWCFKLLPLCQT